MHWSHFSPCIHDLYNAIYNIFHFDSKPTTPILKIASLFTLSYCNLSFKNILQINLQSLTASLVYFGYFVKSKMIQEFLKKKQLTLNQFTNNNYFATIILKHHHIMQISAEKLLPAVLSLVGITESCWQYWVKLLLLRRHLYCWENC